MKTLLLFGALTLSISSFAQDTYVPDNNFETYLENNSMGNGIQDDDYVTTANISEVTYLDVSYMSISDLTGIEDFTALTELWCEGNLLTSLDVSQNTALFHLDCNSNQLTVTNVSQNTLLTSFFCWGNSLTFLDVSQNSILTTLSCSINQLTSLDVSTNTALTYLACNDNDLSCLHLKNGNNNNFILFISLDNPNLTCIEVDNSSWSTANWTGIDPTSSFSENCGDDCSLGLNKFSNASKQLLKIVDLMGRETEYKPNTALIYVYSDGSTQKIFKTD